MATTGSEKQVIVAGIDDSDFSSYALGWIIDHFLLPSLNLNFKLVLVYARPSAASSVGFVGPGMRSIRIMLLFLLDNIYSNNHYVLQEPLRLCLLSRRI